MNCPIDGSRIITDHLLGGEVDRYCLASGHPYLLPAEVAARDLYLKRRAEDEQNGRRPANVASNRALRGTYWKEAS